MLDAAEVVKRAASFGPWHCEPDGRIRNAQGLDPYRAVSGAWMPRPGDDWTVHRVIEAADFPNHPYRRALVAALKFG